VIVADRGLAGAYNSSVLRAAERLIRSRSQEGRGFTVMAIGKKAQAYFRFRHQPVAQQFVAMSDRPTYEDARRVAAVIVPPFLAGEVDLVQIVSTRIRSASSQVVETRQLLPVLPSPKQSGPKPSGVAQTAGESAATAVSALATTARRGPKESSASSSSSPMSSSCWRSSSRCTQRPRSMPRCWRRPLRSTPRANGRCRQPPRTPKSC